MIIYLLKFEQLNNYTVLTFKNCIDLPQSSTQFIIIHVGLILPDSPALGHLLRVHHLELSLAPLPPQYVLVHRVVE